MRIAVYNAHWATAGGGEKYAGSFAQALSTRHDVELLTDAPFDKADLEERLSLDLEACRVSVVETGLVDASAGFDLLLNCSFMNAEPHGARQGIYVVHFPAPLPLLLSTPQRLAAGLLAATGSDRRVRLDWGTGFYGFERGRLGYYRWTSGCGRLHVYAPTGEGVPLRIVFGDAQPSSLPQTPVRIIVDGVICAEQKVGGDRTTTARLTLIGKGTSDPVEIAIESDIFVPRTVDGSADTRRLGVLIRAIQLGRGPAAQTRARFPTVFAPQAPPDFLKSYDKIVANSAYTSSWIRRGWHRESSVLYPPVASVQPAEKQSMVLNVGRFFPRRSGHSKKQLEMVRAFRQLCERGLQGWQLHLVGGCKDEERAYLDLVRRESAGLPLTLHSNASGAELGTLYQRASLYWHATGLGERELRHPDRFEHFGISVVEAMSAGAVPIVLGRAGPRETVVHGSSGLHFDNIDELIQQTWTLTHNPAELARLRQGAIARSERFAFACFAADLDGIISTLGSSRSELD